MSDLANAIKQICDEKGLSYEAVVGTIESALAAAYRKDFGEKNQNIRVEFNPETGKSRVFDVKTIVEDLPEEPADAEAKEVEEDEIKKDKGEEKRDKEIKEEKSKEKKKDDTKKKQEEVKKKDSEHTEDEDDEEVRKFNPKTEIQISDAKLIKKTAKIGEELKMKLQVPDAYGRMAAQTAKQVIIQRLREAERNMIFDEFKNKENEVVSGVVQRKEGRIVLIDLGKGVGVLLGDNQIPGEQYRPGQRIKVFIKEVNMTPKGPEILLSRTSDEILKKVFYLEIPEISNGLIELKAVAREAGSRAKVAVATDSNNVDPIGSCVGQKGARIQTIINELGGEKVDIIEYDEDSAKFINNALSPARILNIELDEKNNKAKVMVASDQLSLAIGKGGQNARLAARLTGWKIDIVEAKTEKDEETKPEADKKDKDKKKDEKEKQELSQEITDKKEEKDKKKKGVSKDNKEEKEEKSEDSKKEVKKEEKDDKEEKSDDKKDPSTSLGAGKEKK